MALARYASALCLAAAAPLPIPAHAQDFYQGKTINVICGFAPGGGYDAYARLLARHISNHIPGRPSLVVQNMAGAGTIPASNHVYIRAPKDGTTIAAVNQNIAMYQLLGGKGAQFEAGKLQWIGSLIASNGIIYTWHTSPTKTIADAMRRETPLGGTGTNSEGHIYTTVLNRLAGTIFKNIHGYAGGSAEIHTAMERGEVEGRSGNSWAGLSASHRHWIDEGKVHVIVQIGAEPEPELKSVPLMIDLVRTEEDRQIVRLITLPTTIGYGYWLAPEVPGERIDILRKAFDAMVQDAEFKNEAAKLKLPIVSRPGRYIEEIVKAAATTPAAVIARATELLEWKQ